MVTSGAGPRPAWWDWVWLALVWVGLSVHDRVWLLMDGGVPDWDQAEYLGSALNFWRALQHPEWLSGRWWTEFWQLAPKTPPLGSVAAAPFFELFGPGVQQAMWLQVACCATFLCASYALGRLLFDRRTALWATAVAACLPFVGAARLRFSLDYPLMTAVTVSFLAVTLWHRRVLVRRETTHGWMLAALAGVSLGAALLVKQPAAFFLAVPFAWSGIAALRRRDWKVLGQVAFAAVLGACCVWPWVRAGWVTILAGGWRATVVSAAREQQAPLWSLAGWTLYLRRWPALVSWPVILSTFLALGVRGLGPLGRRRPEPPRAGHEGRGRERFSLTWLVAFVAGGLLLASLSPNRQPRYILAVVPAFLLIASWSWSRLRGPWASRVRWMTLGVVALASGLNEWPLGGRAGDQVGTMLNPDARARPSLGVQWPHEAIIEHVVARDPWVTSTIGVTAASATVNPENINFFGKLAAFQVYGREAGATSSRVERDRRSFAWFVTARGPGQERWNPWRQQLAEEVARSPDIRLEGRWALPGGGTLELYRQRQAAVEVSRLEGAHPVVVLERVDVPARARPGAALPVTYEWRGPSDLLRHGLVLVTWQPVDAPSSSDARWTHDHGVGFGSLYARPGSAAAVTLLVRERTATWVPPGLPAGRYRLRAEYVDRRTNQVPPVRVLVPETTVTVDAGEPPADAPGLDLVTQLRELAGGLSLGRRGVARLFEELGRIDQYDPVQDFFDQAAVASWWRLRREPSDLPSAYTLVLSRALQRRTEEAREAVRHLAAIDARNPYPLVLAAVVDLYDLRPGAAGAALDRAIALGAGDPEVHGLRAAAAMMRGNLVRAVREARLAQRAAGPPGRE